MSSYPYCYFCECMSCMRCCGPFCRNYSSKNPVNGFVLKNPISGLTYTHDLRHHECLYPEGYCGCPQYYTRSGNSTIMIPRPLQGVARVFAEPQMQPAAQPVAMLPTPPPTPPATVHPMVQPEMQPMFQPMFQPMIQPILHPTVQPTGQPMMPPSVQPMMQTTMQPTLPLSPMHLPEGSEFVFPETGRAFETRPCYIHLQSRPLASTIPEFRQFGRRS